jgi:4-diphosphocytidyl-2-C-methyl-D-erythritol kinase
MRLRTHGKVNLFLRVIGLRRDGFHEVETILHGVNLYDEIEIEASGDEVDVTMGFVEGLAGTLPSKEENLIARAAMLLAEGHENARGARLRVRKGIPVGAGLGGGSSNAAGALVALAEMWGIDLDRDRLFALAEKLGADVPYCIEGGTALATSRGEQLTPLPNIRQMWFVLGGSTEPLLTREVYERWDETGPGQESSSVPLSMALGAGDSAEVATLLHNDLEVPAFGLRPELREKKALLVEAGALGACMSGSGPTTFGIAADEGSASAIAEKVRDSFDWVRVVRSQATCIERVD